MKKKIKARKFAEKFGEDIDSGFDLKQTGMYGDNFTY
jgi:hypothetical protein